MNAPCNIVQIRLASSILKKGFVDRPLLHISFVSWFAICLLPIFFDLHWPIEQVVKSDTIFVSQRVQRLSLCVCCCFSWWPKKCTIFGSSDSCTRQSYEKRSFAPFSTGPPRRDRNTFISVGRIGWVPRELHRHFFVRALILPACLPTLHPQWTIVAWILHHSCNHSI